MWLSDSSVTFYFRAIGPDGTRDTTTEAQLLRRSAPTMGKGKKRGKKAKSREAHDAKKAREAEQYRLQNERGERITEYIRRFLHEMCAYSEACTSPRYSPAYDVDTVARGRRGGWIADIHMPYRLSVRAEKPRAVRSRYVFPNPYRGQARADVQFCIHAPCDGQAACTGSFLHSKWPLTLRCSRPRSWCTFPYRKRAPLSTYHGLPWVVVEACVSGFTPTLRQICSNHAAPARLQAADVLRCACGYVEPRRLLPSPCSSGSVSAASHAMPLAPPVVGTSAIRTGDERDSLMNVMSIGQHGHTQVAAQDLPRMNFPSIKLGFTGSGGEHAVVTPGLRLCSYAECHEVEPEPGAFPACGGCESAWYHGSYVQACGRSASGTLMHGVRVCVCVHVGVIAVADRTCQAKDWKLKVAPTFAHKLTCPHLKQLKMIRQMQLSQQNPHDPDSQQQLLAMLRKMQLEAGAKGGKATSKVSGDGDGDGASSPSAGASAGAGTGAGGGAGAGGSTPVPSTAAAAASDAGTA